MDEYIDRDAVLRDWPLCDEPADAYQFIRGFPAADVVEVVRCRDCKWCHAGYCEKYDDLIPFGCANKPWEDWFCADGKKREES